MTTSPIPKLNRANWNSRGNRYRLPFAMPAMPDLSTAAGRRAWTRALLAPMDENRFDALARQLFAWQITRVPTFRRLCEAHGVTPKNLRSWKDIPAVPQQLFKLEKLYAHGTKNPAAIYETSGTTTGQPGRQHLLDTTIYKAVSVEGARRVGLLDGKVDLHYLVPPQKAARHSSLSAMFGFWQKDAPFWVDEGKFDFEILRTILLRVTKPVGICGTAFSFVHLLDEWNGLPQLELPRGSWILETGGFKGRSREVSKPDLYRQLAKLFSVPDSAIWNEYGMSELSSQAYARGTKGLHQTPPWTRVLVVNPATGREVAVGQQGLVRWIDLANTDSVMALQTLDLAERTSQGFRLIGRLPRTEPRGCSLSIEDLRKEAA